MMIPWASAKEARQEEWNKPTREKGPWKEGEGISVVCHMFPYFIQDDLLSPLNN